VRVTLIIYFNIYNLASIFLVHIFKIIFMLLFLFHLIYFEAHCDVSFTTKINLIKIISFIPNFFAIFHVDVLTKSTVNF
jgi:hypothetical protein